MHDRVRGKPAAGRRTAAALAVSVLFLLPLPAAAGSAGDPARADPLERVNRAVFHFNERLSGHLAPVVDWVEESVPEDVLHGARGIVENLEEPVTVVSNLLAGDLDAADVAARRFLINTFMGYAGVVDVAEEHYGYVREPADLRRPLCRYGLPAGPLIVVPFFGETHLRDLVGLYGTMIALYEVLGSGYVPYRASTASVRFFDVEATSLDPDPEIDAISPSSTYEAMRARVFAHADSQC